MKVLVIGGGGFLGEYIVKQLLRAHEGAICILARSSYPNLQKLGVESIQGDIRNPSDIEKACHQVDVIFHTAAKVGLSGKYKDFYETNVIGTQNVIQACQKKSVHKLIFTSSSSVTYEGKDQIHVDESVPYPKTYLSSYSQTKAMAEKLVLSSNNENLLTAALRPHLIWGPKDKYIIPRILEQGRKRKLWIIGDGKNLTDISYVENVAEAHLLAAKHLYPRSPVCGKTYFITQGKPVVLWEWVNHLLTSFSIPPVTRHMPFKAAYTLGAFLETLYRVLRFRGEPAMTRLIAQQLSTTHTYNISAAQKDFGFIPRISTEEGLKRLKEFYQRAQS